MSLKKKLIIGTAQFEGGYGKFNKKSLSKKELVKILLFLKKKKINSLDTSIHYRNVDRKIGLVKNNWNVTTKLKLNKKVLQGYHENKIQSYIVEKLLNTKKKMRISKIDTLLINNFELLDYKSKYAVFNVIKNLKKKKYFNKFGYSIYNFGKLKSVLLNFRPDVLQCPINIFDKRILNKRLKKIIENYRIKIFARSIFLQGLLLQKYKSIPKNFMRWKKILSDWNSFTEDLHNKKLSYCTSYVYQINLVDKLIIGVNNLDQLKQILSIKVKKKFNTSKFTSNDDKLINPSKW